MRELLKNVASLPDVEIGETAEDFKTVAERTLNNREKVIRYLGSAELLMDAYDHAYDQEYYIPKRIKLGILVKMLAADSVFMRTYQKTDSQEVRETRCLPNDVTMDYSVMVYDDTVVLYGKDEKLFSLSITSPSIATSMKAMFDDMWRNATP